MLCTSKEHERLRKKYRSLRQACKDVFESCETKEQVRVAHKFADRARLFETDPDEKLFISWMKGKYPLNNRDENNGN